MFRHPQRDVALPNLSSSEAQHVRVPCFDEKTATRHLFGAFTYHVPYGYWKNCLELLQLSHLSLLSRAPSRGPTSSTAKGGQPMEEVPNE